MKRKTTNANRAVHLPIKKIEEMSIPEIRKSTAAVKMLLHDLRRLETENASLKNERNTFQTYISEFERKKTLSRVQFFLNMISTILIGLGTNYIASNNATVGWPLLLVGILVFGVVAYLEFFSGEKI